MAEQYVVSTPRKLLSKGNEGHKQGSVARAHTVLIITDESQTEEPLPGRRLRSSGSRHTV